MKSQISSFVKIFFILYVLVLCGCVTGLDPADKSIGTVARDTPPVAAVAETRGLTGASASGNSVAILPGGQETIVVMGVRPRLTRINLHTGVVNGGDFTISMKAGEIISRPNDGYVVGKMPANQPFALVGYKFYLDANDQRGYYYSLCNSHVQVYTSTPGKVLYLGDVDVSGTANNNAVLRYAKNFTAAKEFIEEKYPQFKGRLEPASAQHLQFICKSEPSYIMMPIFKKR